MDFEITQIGEEDLREFGIVESSPSSGPNIESNTKEGLKDVSAEASDARLNDSINNDALKNSTEDDSQYLTPSTSTHTKLDFNTPAQLLAFFDGTINSLTVTLHPWQVEISDELGNATPTSLAPLRYCLCAANGSGKDLYVIAPFALWFITTKIKSRVVITSSSGTQLTSQTELYVKNLADKINQWCIENFGGPILKVNQRYIRCILTGSEIRMYATDEPGKAEGYHPMEPNCEFAIIINEAKSIPEEIFQAITRCTGFNYWLEVSTPGEPFGHFYYAFTHWKKTKRVTAFDCPHLGLDYINEVKQEYGESSAIYRSMVLALFTSLGGNAVISQELLNKLLDNPPKEKFQNWPLRIGIDIAAGGDENSFTVTRGNKKIFHEAWVEFDTTITTDRIERLFLKFQLKKDHEYIFMDDGNVGHSVADMLIRRGWNIKRIINQSTAVNKREFTNRGAENWFRVARLVEEGILLLDRSDTKFIDQLAHRYYKQPINNARITLESKKEAKANGHPSPDRADSYILSFFGLTINDFLQEDPTDTITTKIGRKVKVNSLVHELQIESHYDEEETFAVYKEKKPSKGKLVLGSSLSELLANEKQENIPSTIPYGDIESSFAE